MRFIFFDIECANCYGGIGKICEFGYVICNESFEILSKKEIMINPGSKEKFNLVGRKNRPDIILAHSHEEYRKCPEFDIFYDNIKFLLTQKDTLLFGHSVNNDIRFINSSIERYHLPFIDFEAYDVQKFLSYFSSSRKQLYKLEDASAELIDKETRSQLHEHSSVDDALMTMLVTREICHKLECSLYELIDLCDKSMIKSIDSYKKQHAKK